MKNAKKGLLIAEVVLALTLGIFIIKNYLLSTSGFKFGSLLDLILLLPAIPFLTLVWLFPNQGTIVGVFSFILAIAFWLLVGYGIGKWMDRRKK